MEFNIKKLSLILEYKNQDVIYRFLKLFDISKEETEELFYETKKWLYALALNQELYKKGEVDFLIGVNDDLLMLDEMWHNFILFTIDYKEFCNDYFGFFIHHQPLKEKDGKNQARQEKLDFKKVQDERKIFFKKQYSFIYDVLGEDTLVKWHKIWPVKYSKENIKTLRK